MPLLCKYEPFPGVCIGVWKIDETVQELLSLSLSNNIATDEIAGCKSVQRQSEWMAVRLALVSLLGKNVEIKYYDDGKPYIDVPGIAISISHTAGYAVVALSSCGVIGVDVERRDRNALSLAHRYMNEDEGIAHIGIEANLSALLHWSMKESLFKVVGNVGGTFKHNITVKPFQIKDEGTAQILLHDISNVEDTMFVVCYSVYEEYLITLCMPGK